MPHENPSIISHVSVGASDLDRSLRFYDAVMGALGIARVMEHDGMVAYGRAFPEFWVNRPLDGRPATAGNGVHFGFLARDRQQIHAFHAAALEAGGTDDGAPGFRSEYTPTYYACFVRDPDGNKIEAMCFASDNSS